MSAPKHPRHLVTNAFPGGSTTPKVGVVLCELHFCDSRAAPAMLCSRSSIRNWRPVSCCCGSNTEHRTALVALISSYPPPASRLNRRFTVWGACLSTTEPSTTTVRAVHWFLRRLGVLCARCHAFSLQHSARFQIDGSSVPCLRKLQERLMT
jgi:hypothetical protein